MRTAEFEFVEYRKRDLLHASQALIYNYAEHSGLQGASQWSSVLVVLADVIMTQSPDQIRWQTPGLNIIFIGASGPRPRIKGETLVYSPTDPQFILEEDVETPIRPVIRTHLERVTEAIVEEMREVYKMHPQKDGLFTTLTFPREWYAQRVKVVDVPLLDHYNEKINPNIEREREANKRRLAY